MTTGKRRESEDLDPKNSVLLPLTFMRRNKYKSGLSRDGIVG